MCGDKWEAFVRIAHAFESGERYVGDREAGTRTMPYIMYHLRCGWKGSQPKRNGRVGLDGLANKWVSIIAYQTKYKHLKCDISVVGGWSHELLIALIPPAPQHIPSVARNPSGKPQQQGRMVKKFMVLRFQLKSKWKMEYRPSRNIYFYCERDRDLISFAKVWWVHLKDVL